jgi:tetratricopeptide (TPR) repeat protein
MLAKRLFHPGALAVAAILSCACQRSPQAREAAYLKRGKEFLEKKDAGRAQLEFLNAAKVMPKDAEPQYQLGLAYVALGKTSFAASAFQKAIGLDPKRSDAQLMLAQLMAGARNTNLVQEGLNRLQAIVSASPGNLEAVDSLAVTEWRMGQTGEAEKLLEGALEKSPADLRSSIVLSRLKLTQNDPAGAEEVLTKAVASAPRSPQAALALGLLYGRLNKADQAERAFRSALEADPKYGPALMGLAAVQVVGNRIDEAEQMLGRAAALPDPIYAPVHANFLYQNGKRDAALAEYEKLANLHPDDRVARGRLLAAYLDMGKEPQAQALVAAALKKNPKDVDARYQRAKMYLKSGKSAEAIEDLNQVRQLIPKAIQVHLALAAAYRAQHLPRMERRELQEVLQVNKTHLTARLDLAANFLSGGDAAQALRLLDEAPDAEKGDLPLIVMRNRALLGLGKTQELRSVLDRALPQVKSPDLLMQDAVLRQGQRDYAGARASAEEALKVNPEDATAALMIADTYLAQNQPDRAQARLTDILAAHHDSAPLLYVMGIFHLRAGRIGAARQYLEAAKKASPSYFQADFALVDLDRREKQPERARQRLQAVLAADRRNTAALMKLAAIEEEAGNAAQAMASYRAVLDADGSNLTAMNNLAYHLALENPDEALKLAQQAAEAAPDSPDVQDTLGWVFYRKGIYNKATEYLKSAYTRSPTAQREFHLAMAYIKQGDTTTGRQMLAAALAKSPGLAKTELGW